MNDNESIIIEYRIDNGEGVFADNELTCFRFTNFMPDKRCEKRTCKWEVWGPPHLDRTFLGVFDWRPVSISKVRRDFRRLPYRLEVSVTKKVDYIFWM